MADDGTSGDDTSQGMTLARTASLTALGTGAQTSAATTLRPLGLLQAALPLAQTEMVRGLFGSNALRLLPTVPRARHTSCATARARGGCGQPQSTRRHHGALKEE